MTYVGVVDGAVTSELRRAVLRPNYPVGKQMFGDTLVHAVHVAAIEEGVPVCACLLIPSPYPYRREAPAAWQLRAMATAEEHRGKGYGRLVVDAAIDEVIGHGGRLLWLEARDYAIGFYERMGMTAEGPVYLHPETQIPHRKMFRDLPIGEPSAGPVSSA
jgi:hypothetical protein